ncbi:signal peptidase I [Anaerolentibacter hominis]|uniref:signal peptidase I n=1 Tax=Anaerolentibacter hominis TaxID=3079009 RepID=UPI0031B80A59
MAKRHTIADILASQNVNPVPVYEPEEHDTEEKVSAQRETEEAQPEKVIIRSEPERVIVRSEPEKVIAHTGPEQEAPAQNVSAPGEEHIKEAVKTEIKVRKVERRMPESGEEKEEQGDLGYRTEYFKKAAAATAVAEDFADDMFEEEPEDGPEPEREENRGRTTWKSVVKELLFYAVLFVLLLFIVPTFILQRTVVSGHSMENTLQDEQQLLVEKVTKHFKEFERFDIVVFYPYGRDSDDYYVKRVIGLPGETVQIIGADIYINGEKLDESYGKDPITFSGIAVDPLTLGDDEYFLMGDNREVSFDSRYEQIGPIHKNMIEGKVLLRIWPFSEFGRVE